MGNEGKEGRETEKFDFFGKVELLSATIAGTRADRYNATAHLRTGNAIWKRDYASHRTR